MRNDRANRQQTDLQGDLEGLIRDSCSENGFGSDPATVYTFTELANRLLDALAGGISSNDALASSGTGLYLSDEETIRKSAPDRLVNNNLLPPFVEGESHRADMILGVPASHQDVKLPTDGPKDDHSSSPVFFLDASGDWRVVFHDDHWWAVGHHFVYPAKDRNHAERRRQELSDKLRSVV